MPIHTLMYHYVRNNEDYKYNVYSRRESEFKEQVLFLKDNYHSISLDSKSEIDHYLNSNEEGFVLTFDDSYKDHYWCAEFLHDNKSSFNNPSATLQLGQNIFHNCKSNI